LFDEMMGTDVYSVEPGRRIADLYDELPEGSPERRQRLYPVLGADNRLVGVLSWSAVLAARSAGDDRRVGEATEPSAATRQPRIRPASCHPPMRGGPSTRTFCCVEIGDQPRRIVVGDLQGGRGRTVPCAGLDVRALLNHLVGAVWMFTRVNQGQAAGEDAGDVVGEDAVGAVATATQANLASWTRPGAFDGERSYLFGTFPAAAAGLINLVEAVVHNWDLAKATGGDSYSSCADRELERFAVTDQLGEQVDGRAEHIRLEHGAAVIVIYRNA
jgi:uncharacterized protein (TIGR03086 family)